MQPCLRDIEKQLECAPICQIWNNLTMKTNNYSNGLCYPLNKIRVHDTMKLNNKQRKEKENLFHRVEWQLVNVEGIIELEEGLIDTINSE